MINRTLIRETLGKYVAQRNMVAAVDDKNKKIVDFCVDYIKANYTQDLINFYNEDKTKLREDRLTLDQEDVSFGYWELESSKSEITSVPIEDRYEANKYFSGAFTLSLKSFGLPRFFSGSAWTDLPEDFLKPFKEKVTGLVVQVNACMKEISALEKTLMDPTMTLTSVKKDYPELYNLIKK